MWPSFADLLPIFGLAALSLAPSVAADYYIDNANKTVLYAASGTIWRTFSFATQNLSLDVGNATLVVDSSKCYDQNYALAACTVVNKCQITLPFTGSGISVYVINAGFQGISASLTIDGAQSVTTTLPAPAPPSYQTPNVSLFNFQSLSSTDHTATINLLDWNDGTTSLYFDYALINESHIESSTSSLPHSSPMTSNAHTTTTAVLQIQTSQLTNTSSTSPTIISTFIGSTHTSGPTSAVSNSDSSVNLGALLGGTFGGFIGLIAIVAAVIFFKKLKSRYTALDESRKPDPFPATPAPARVRTVPLPVQFQTDEKKRIRLAARDMALHHSPGQSGRESGDFHILSAVDR